MAKKPQLQKTFYVDAELCERLHLAAKAYGHGGVSFLMEEGLRRLLDAMDENPSVAPAKPGLTARRHNHTGMRTDEINGGMPSLIGLGGGAGF